MKAYPLLGIVLACNAPGEPMYYSDANEHQNDTLDEAIIDHFGFCGCGSPDAFLAYVRDTLQLLQDWAAEEPKDWDTSYAAYRAKQVLLHPSTGIEMMIYYWLDQHEYTEHGGSVPGWLTDKGKELLDALNDWHAEYLLEQSIPPVGSK